MNELGKGRISAVTIEYTPIGEKILVSTSRPGLVIGRKGEKIAELTRVLKKNFKLDNPHIEILEIREPLLDSQLVADEIALLLERKGSLKFKVVAYKMLQQIIKQGALGAELALSGKLPSDRARTWRFSQGYLKKTGDPSKLVDTAQSQAVTPLGVIGIQVKILRPDADLKDKIDINDAVRTKIKLTKDGMDHPIVVQESAEKPKKKTLTKKTTKKSKSKEAEE
jgi:small subunit ribosomal protein S3